MGNEIYRRKDVCVYEVDGSVESTYCRGLILLMAIFNNDSCATSVDSSACDVVAQASVFYVLMKNTRDKHHIMGFFSKVICLKCIGYVKEGCYVILPYVKKLLMLNNEATTCFIV